VILDFAAEYAYEEENDYGYSSLKWTLANKVPEGSYEIKVAAECDNLGGPADIDLYTTPILTGVIDLTPPEQYGQALPLRDSVLIGEEMIVVFTEPIRCDAFDLVLIIEDLDLELDKHDPHIQVSCNGNKIGFALDPTQVDAADFIGKQFTVEIGKVDTSNTISFSNVLDLNGNAIETNVMFEKRFADIDLDQASTSFDVTLNSMNICPDGTDCASIVKDEISLLLGLTDNDSDRIEVESVTKLDSDTVKATVKVLPQFVTEDRLLRRVGPSKKALNRPDHSVSLFKKLQAKLQKEEEQSKDSSKDRMLSTASDGFKHNTFLVAISNMKILPSDSDAESLKTDPNLTENEEYLYHYDPIANIGDNREPYLKTIEQKSLIDGITQKEKELMNEVVEDMKTKITSEIDRVENKDKVMINALLRELKETKDNSQSQLKLLRMELMVVMLACVGVSISAFLRLK